jgi:predicted MFS family arabinose efflux permease
MSQDRLLTRSFALCAAANLLQALSFNLYLHFPGFLRGLGADEVMIGLFSGLTAVAAIAARPSVGRAMDARGRRGVILRGGVVNTIVCSMYLGVTKIGAWLVLVRIVHGLAEAMLFSSLFTLAADMVPAARRTEGLALFGISGILPVSLGGLLGDAILSRASYAVLFACSSLLAALSLLASLPLRDRPRPAHHETPPSRGFSAAATQRDLLPLWFIGSVFAIALSAVFTFVTTFVLTTGIGSVGLFFSFYSGAAVVLRLFLGWLPERIGPKAALFPALAFQCAGLLALAAATRTRDVALAGALCGLGHGFAFPILSGLVVTRARDAERGAALSLFTAIFDFGVLIGGPAFGAVIRAQGYPTAYRTAAGVVFVGAAGFAVWDARVARRARARVESTR